MKSPRQNATKQQYEMYRTLTASEVRTAHPFPKTKPPPKKKAVKR